MALPALIQAAITRLRGTNNNRYNAGSNPLGWGDGGHRVNFVPNAQAICDIAGWQATTADNVASLREAVADDLTETAQDVVDAGAARDKADAFANAPADTLVETGKYSARHFASKASGFATAADGARQAAADLLDLFDDRFLGAKANDPTTDNDGNPLVAGAIVFNTTAGTMKVWSGSAWQVFVPTAADYLLKSGGILTGLLTFAASQFATKAQAEAGTDAEKLMTAQRVAEAIAKLSPQSGMTLVSSATVSSPVQFVDISVPNALYDNFELRITDLIYDAETNGPTLQISTGGTVLSANDSYQSTNIITPLSGGSATAAITVSRDLIPLSNGGSAANVKVGTPVNLVLDIFKPALTTGGRSFAFRGGFQYNSTGNGDPLSLISGTARVKGTGKVDGLRISQPNQSTIRITGGKFDLYGLKK